MTDLINGLFECLGAFFIIPSVLKLIKEKEIKGYSPMTLVFFTSWGIWNIYFYPQHGLYLSFLGGIFVSIINVIYLSLIIFYMKFYKKV